MTEQNQDLHLDLHDIHLWLLRLDHSKHADRAAEATLSRDELVRADKFRFPQHKGYFVRGRSALRNILSRYVDADASQITFDYGKYGKPKICDLLNTNGISFNVSHSGNVAIYALSRNRSIGVDIEFVRPLSDADHMAEHFFSIAEYRGYCALPECQKLTAFFDCWTRKEAYIKATGYGLSMPLDSFDISFAPHEAPEILRDDRDPDAASHWQIFALKPSPGYTGALVVEKQDQEETRLQWKSFELCSCETADFCGDFLSEEKEPYL